MDSAHIKSDERIRYEMRQSPLVIFVLSIHANSLNPPQTKPNDAYYLLIASGSSLYRYRLMCMCPRQSPSILHTQSRMKESGTKCGLRITGRLKHSTTRENLSWWTQPPTKQTKKRRPKANSREHSQRHGGAPHERYLSVCRSWLCPVLQGALS